MAKNWGVNLKEFNQLQDKISKMNNEFENFLKEYMVEMAEMVIAKAKRKTPVGTPESTGIPNYVGGTLRRNWQIGDVRRVGNNIEVEILNPTEYATEVEYGHRIMGGAGHSIEVGWKDGRFMLTTSVNEIRAQMPLRYAQKLKTYCDRLEL